MSRIGTALDMWESKRRSQESAPTAPQKTDAGLSRLSEFERESIGTGTEPVADLDLSLPAHAEPHFSHESSGDADGESSPSGRAAVTSAQGEVSMPGTEADDLPAVSLRVGLDDQARLVTTGSNSVSVEQYRRMAAVLHDIQLQQGLKTLMVTSALPSEGKTLTVINLALTLSHSYAKRVLLVDADLRWPSIHKVLGLPNGVGLSDVLKGQQTDLPIRHVTPRLSVLTAGRPGPAPLAGLTSPRMAALIDECASHFDWVLIDTPPVGLLPDAQPLARLTRAVVFVIAAGQTPAKLVERAVAELGHDCIIGTVLNRVDDRRIPQAGYYDYYDRDHPSAAQ